MTFRILAACVTLLGLGAILIVLADEPDRLWLALGKLGDGGMWTALAAFVAIAAVLGYRRRDAARGPRRSSSPPR